MGIYRGPNNVTKDLEFGFDIGHGVVDNTNTTRFYKGKPVDNMATDPTFLNSTAGTFASSAWGGDTGNGEFATNTSPEGGGLMYINNNTSTPAGSGGNYNDFDVNGWTLTNGVTYTRSWWAKSNITQTINGHMLSVNGGGNNTYILGGDTDLVANVWKRVSHTFTYTLGTSTNWRFRSINYHQSKVYIANIQLEVGSHASPFTATSRSDTASLIDLKRSTSIDVGSLSFSNTAEVEFDGSDDKITLSHADSPVTNVSYEMVVKFDSLPATNSYKSIWQKQTNWNDAGGVMMQFIYNAFRWSYGNSWGGAVSYSQSNFTTGKYYHIVGTVDNINGANAKLYVDGVQVGSTGTGSKLNTTAVLNIGEGNGGRLDGSLGVFKMYSNTLTAEDVKQNYNSYKNRFNI